MDAISFVLGVNSMQLRSQNLKDFIYRGGAMNEDNEKEVQPQRESRRKAYVMIVYQEDNGHELRFVRSVNARGQSEYKINEKVVPWKTYNATLEKENILIRARNFLVFQGDVEHVASQSPKDLTTLIEHISGSLEYKDDYDKLKIEQDRAIENSAFSFNKKRGINSEIKQYQEQKAEAERYETLGEEKQSLIVKYLLWKLYHVEKNIDSCENEAEERRAKINAVFSDQSSVDDEFKNARKELAVLHRERVKKELSIKNLEKDLQHYRLNGISIDEKVSHLQKKVQQTTENHSRVAKDFDHQTSVITDLEDDLARLNAVIEECSADLQASISKSGPILDAQQIEEYNAMKQQVSNQAVYEKHQLSNLQRQHKTNQEVVYRMEEKITDLRERQGRLGDDEQAMIQYAHDVEVQISNTTKDLQVKQLELEALRKEQSQILQKEQSLNEKLQDILNRLMQAKIDQNESEKELRFKECLRNLQQIYPGFHGRLADLCTPTQRKYDLAVSIALGRNIDAVVVDNEKTAMDCIQYMRDQRAGHATFIPLDTIVAPVVDERFRTIAKGAKLAVDVLEYESQYERAFLYACGNALVCDTLAIAKYICYERNQEVKAVTLDGTVIHKNGLITGGESVGSAKQWEERELEGLKQNRDNLLAQLNELSKKKRRGSAEENAKSECEGLETQLNYLRDELKGTQTKLAGVQDELRHLANQIAVEEIPYQQAKNELHTQFHTISEFEAHIAQIEDEIFSDFCSRIQVANIREYESSQLRGAQELNEKQLNFKTQRSKVENQLLFERQQLQELQERVSRLESVLNTDTGEIEAKNAEKEEYIAKLQKIEDNIAKIEAQVTNLKTKEDEQEKLVEERRKSLSQKGQEADQMIKHLSDVETSIEKLHAERMSIFRRCKLEDIDIPLNQGSMEDVPMDDSELHDSGDAMDLDEPSQMSMASSTWSIAVNYSSLTTYLKDNADGSIEDDFQNKIRDLSQTLDEMAPNLKAVDRLEGVESRLKQTEGQFEKARKAAKRAKEKFTAVKQKRYNLFMDAYNHISEKIDQVYKDLTKSEYHPLGGTAYLSLEDNEEPYLEGIRYHAMPPMKRFRDMEQLSGGEKTMAALALLFAIHSYHPSPFFVLDEVDAALDNANVSKIATYIREHASDRFQFIVISLKSMLYQKAESLVGIYRDQEINSSRVLTLALEQYEE
ncbi:Structural maintenance of chromosomes protein 1 [Umbelopsis nana]